MSVENKLKKTNTLDFPGGPVAKTASSQGRGPWIQSLVRGLDRTCRN